MGSSLGDVGGGSLGGDLGAVAGAGLGVVGGPLGMLAGGAIGQSLGGPGGGISSLLGGVDGSNALSGALSDEQQGVLQSNQIQQGMYNNTSAMLQPWQQAGSSGLSQLQSAMPSLTAAFNPSDLQNTPGYQFALTQGENAISNSAAARGINNSGGTMANLNNYAQQAASTQYQTALQNYNTQNQQTYGMLSGLANYGQTANSQMAGVNTSTANNMSSNVMSGANAAASATTAQGQIAPGLLSSLIGAGGTIGGAAMKPAAAAA